MGVVMLHVKTVLMICGTRLNGAVTDGYRWFIANVILNECEVTVAEDESGIAAFLARQREEVRLILLALTGSAWHAANRCSKGQQDRRTRTLVFPGE